jgi:hypothetical protein
MRYLPDVSVLLLEVTGSRRIEVNEEGGRVEDWLTDYKLKKAIRGKSFGSWKNVRFQRTIPSPMDPTRQIANQIWPETKIGQEVRISEVWASIPAGSSRPRPLRLTSFAMHRYR